MKSIIATGIAIALIFLGIGGCCYLVEKGAAERIKAENLNK